MALPEARVLIPTVRRSVKEEGGKPLSTREQIQWRLLNREKEVVNVIPLVKLAVVWRKAVEHSVYAICIAWRMMPLNSEGFEGNEKIGAFSMHSLFRGRRHSAMAESQVRCVQQSENLGALCWEHLWGEHWRFLWRKEGKAWENLYYVSLLEIISV